MPQEFHSAEELAAAVGKSLGASDWHAVEQQQIDRFADATDDHQWIHVDLPRASAGPFANTIAHGYLTLSLVNALLPQLISVPTAVIAINRGCNKVRFPAPVPAGSRIRALGELAAVDVVDGGVDVVVRVTIEIEGHAKPACVADTVRRFLFESSPVP
jgi:acyl dehydratase